MSAAYLQALHAEDGDEPVEAGTSAPVVVTPATNGKHQPDLESESAFPTLGANASGKGKKAMNGLSVQPAVSPLWGASKSPLLDRPDTPASAASSAHSGSRSAAMYRDTLTLDARSIQLGNPLAPKPVKRGDEPEPTSLGDAAALIMKLNPAVKVDASTAKASSTFLFVGPNEDVVRKARNDLLARIVKKAGLLLRIIRLLTFSQVTLVYEVPTSVKGHIIGTKGESCHWCRSLKS
jgi:hypothetical protein